MGVACWWPGPLLDHDNLGHGSRSLHHESGCLHGTFHFQAIDLHSLCWVMRETEWGAALVATSFP